MMILTSVLPLPEPPEPFPVPPPAVVPLPPPKAEVIPLMILSICLFSKVSRGRLGAGVGYIKTMIGECFEWMDG